MTTLMRRIRQLGGNAAIALDTASGAASGASAGPIGAAIGAAAGLIEGLIANSGCGQTCIIATQLVNQLGPQVQAVHDNYVHAAQRTPQMQQDALAEFDQAWAFLSGPQGCGNPQLGTAGKNCLRDYGRGGRWDWFKLRDDIAATAPNAPNPSPLQRIAGALNVPEDLVIAGGLVLLGAVL